ncbi:MAG TPA: fasciclin domain-containing protein, partial [Candidatus Limnocylindrales bacterium]|nr:fasciclin domain-containing protein [Candidatus Limnocylindrales bacterium]
MRKVFLVFSLLVVVAVMAIPAFAQDQQPTIAEVLANDPDGRFTTLLAAVDAAGLGDAIAGLDGATLLAPTNDAFVASLEALGLTAEDVLANPEVLTQILTYHVLPGEYFFRNLTSGPAIATLQGEDVQFDLTDGVFTVNGVGVSDIDNVASNGIIQVIDGVLVPPSVMSTMQPQVEATPSPEATEATTPVVETRPSVVEWLTNDTDGRFTTLLAAVDAAGIGPALEG